MNKLKPSTVTLGLAAIFCGLVAAYAVKKGLEPRLVNRQLSVVVPAHNLPKFSRIRPNDLTTKQVPPEQIPADAVTDAAQLVWRTAKENLLANQPIVPQALYGVGETPTLADQLPAGQRAVTFPVDRMQALGGLLVPESRIDISLTFVSNDSRYQGKVTKTILNDVRVLATSEQRFRSEEQMPDDFRSVTVAVNPDQANQLILAQQHGTLSVTLRGESDPANANTQEIVSVEQITGLDGRKPAPFAARVWRGSNSSEVNFQGDQTRTPDLGTPVRPTPPVSIYRPTQVGRAPGQVSG